MVLLEHHAEIAQLVEHFTRNEGVVGSSPIFSFYKMLGIQCLCGFLASYFCRMTKGHHIGHHVSHPLRIVIIYPEIPEYYLKFQILSHRIFYLCDNVV